MAEGDVHREKVEGDEDATSWRSVRDAGQRRSPLSARRCEWGRVKVGARHAAGQACRVAVLLEEVAVLHGAEREGAAAGQSQTAGSAAH